MWVILLVTGGICYMLYLFMDDQDERTINDDPGVTYAKRVGK